MRAIGNELEIKSEEVICHSLVSRPRSCDARVIIQAQDSKGNWWRAERVIRLKFRKQK